MRWIEVVSILEKSKVKLIAFFSAFGLWVTKESIPKFKGSTSIGSRVVVICSIVCLTESILMSFNSKKEVKVGYFKWWFSIKKPSSLSCLDDKNNRPDKAAKTSSMNKAIDIGLSWIEKIVSEGSDEHVSRLLWPLSKFLPESARHEVDQKRQKLIKGSVDTLMDRWSSANDSGASTDEINKILLNKNSSKNEIYAAILWPLSKYWKFYEKTLEAHAWEYIFYQAYLPSLLPVP